MPDLDDVFKLATPKYVYIRDRYLGILKYTFMLLIFCYVVVYEIMYTCDHLVPHTAGGFGTITMEHPVIKCEDRTCLNKYKTIASLKYCDQSAEAPKRALLAKGRGLKDKDDKANEEEDGKKEKKEEVKSDAEEKGPQIGDFITKPKTCRYIDNDRLTLEEIPNEIFLPMRYVSYTQEMDTNCYDPLMKGFAGHIPKKNLECKKGWVTKDTQEYYVADIGDFTLSFQHSFLAPDIGKAGVSTDYKGFFAACPTNHPSDVATDCKRTPVPHTTGKIAPEDLEGTVSTKDLGIESLTGTKEGLDEITFGDLLKLTPAAQNYSWHDDVPDRKLPKAFGHPDTSLRESGGMLMLSIAYDNTGYMRPGIPGIDMPKFGLGAVKPITYTYRPYFIPTKENKRVEVLQKTDESTDRIVNVWYGVTVQMSFEGAIVVFSFSQLLKGFTTGLVLLSSATTIVVYLAIYVFKHKDKYLLQMYQYTEDMSTYKQLDHGKLDCTSFTGKRMLDKRGKGDENAELTNKEITDILVDYEVRLNRVDGRDPKLAFIDNSEAAVGVAALRKTHTQHREAFFKQALGGGAE